jgi:hypothetical protein
MKNTLPLPSYNKYTVAGLLVATMGVIIQMLSGANYPAIPPVFFILLLPAGLLFKTIETRINKSIMHKMQLLKTKFYNIKILKLCLSDSSF